MNQTEFSIMHIESKDMLMRPYKEGWISWSLTESMEHYLTKCKIVRLLKAGMPTLDLERWTSYYLWSQDIPKLKPSQRPKLYCEAKFAGRTKTKYTHRADIFVAASLEGRVVIEIADTESEKSIERKRKYFEKRGIKFYVVRI